MTLEERIGSQLVFGIPGTTITPEIIRHFQDTHCGGLILYRINFQSPDQLRKLISDLETALGRKLLVCTDHEGGRVIMFRDGITVFPSSQAIGKTGNTQFARGQGEQEGRELRRLGIDVNFAPVLDVLTPTHSPNIGIRAYGSDPDLVAKMGAARLSAMQVEGLSAVAKHFPGLGPASLDPHLKLPSIAVTWEELESVHLTPFYRAMRTAVHGIMTSHPLYPNLDSTPQTPATFSKKIVKEFLRGKTGYKGVIFTDDLEMGAIREICPIGEAAVRSVEAGHDVVLSCHDMKAQREVYEALLAAYKSGRLSTQELEASNRRIANLASKRMDRFAEQPGTPARVQRETELAQALVKDITSQSVTVLKNGPALAASGSTTIIFPKLSSASDTIMVEEALCDEKTFLSKRFSGASIHIVALEPSTPEIDAARQAAQTTDQTVLFLYDAHMISANHQLLDAVQAAAKKLVVVLMRDVYDAEWVKADVLCLTNYGYRVCDLEAVIGKLLSVPVSTS